VGTRGAIESPNTYRDGDVAIVGIGCRFPGGVHGPQQFWRLLSEGVDAIKEAPASRPGFRDLYDPDPRRPGHLYSYWGGFLQDVESFDANFFGISPREATRIDPQHRLLLELVWEACEDAGIQPHQLAGSRTGVFIGISTHDYGDMQMYPTNRADIDLYSNSGTATSIAANRISYIYDLRGPSMAVDTACSSALTAVHLSCQSLRNGDCDLAIAGGVQLVLTPELTIGFCKASMLSRDGRCKAFDDDANGYVRGEGGGVVLLKSLRSALACGDPIYSVIRATAINEDGRTQGMTVPSRAAQQAMLEIAIAKAELAPADIQYIEAHGPGTAVGDPIEANALGNVMAKGRNKGDYCAIGSVKTNIGHLEAASGIAGLIKVALALKHRQIPPSLNFSKANHAIDLEALHLRVVTVLEPWPNSEKLAVAGVNSFGFGGANAHAILQEGPEPAAVARTEEQELPHLLVVSARAPEALNALAVSYCVAVGEPNCQHISDICSTAARHRSHHEHRLAIVARKNSDFTEGLSAFANGEMRLNVMSGKIATGGPPELGFVFSGMGPQWWGMGRQLRAQEPVFRSVLERCDEALRRHADWSLLEELSKGEDESRVASPELAQVTNFAIQVALTELWASFGITPQAVIGHSGGAMAAAYVAGVYNLEDAIRLCYHRSRLQGRPSNAGKMLAVGAPYTQIAELVQGHEDRISLAAVNGPSAITLAGDPETLERIATNLQERQIFARMLPVTIAYHSPAMDKIKDEFLSAVNDLRGQTARLRLLSDTTGTWADGADFNNEYWWTAIRQPVLFSEGMKSMVAEGIHTFVEISPHPVLAPSIVECLKDQNATGIVVPSIRRKEDEREIMLRSLGALYCAGFSPNWEALQRGPTKLVELPGYPWQRERLWYEPTTKSNGANFLAERKPGDHPLLGARTRSARPTWESHVGLGETAYLQDHVVQGAAVFPGAAYVELALAARAGMDIQNGVLLRNIELLKPLVLNSVDPTELQLALDADGRHFEVFSSAPGDRKSWICHARGTISPLKRSEELSLDIEAEKSQFLSVMDPVEFYDRMAARGLAYGPAFRGVSSLATANHRAMGMISVPELAGIEGYQIHPALLDAAFQLLVSAAETDENLKSDKRLFLPTQIREVTLNLKPGGSFWAFAKVTEISDSHVTGDVQLVDLNGRVCAEIHGLFARLVEASGASTRDTIDQWLYEYQWESKLRPPAGAAVPLPASLFAGALHPNALQALSARATTAAIQTGWTTYYEQVEQRLNELATAYAAAAFVDLGFEFQQDASVSFDVLAGSSNSGWRQSLFQQLCVMLQRADMLRLHSDGLKATGKRVASPQSMTDAILAEFPKHRLDVELLARCGPKLADVLTAKCDGRDVLFTPAGFTFLESFYRESPASAFYNAMLADVLSELTASRGQTRPLYILEVGAGTGGTTAHLLPKLDGPVNYIFSDVSPAFLERAQAKFSDCPFFGTQTFDATEEPGPQGLQPCSFDLIIGANVVHATPELETTLHNLRGLLAPGGVLLLLEITSHPYWLDIAFGLMDAWWSFEDRELRPDHPLLTGRKWQLLLQQCGFEDATVLSDRVETEPAQSILIAHAPAAEIARVAEFESPKHWLIYADQRGVGERLATTLSAMGCSSTLIYAGGEYRQTGGRFELRPEAAEDVVRMRDELKSVLSRAAGIAHLWSLDLDNPTSNMDASFKRAQDLGCGSVTHIVQHLLDAMPDAPTLALVTAGAQPLKSGVAPSLMQSPLWGYGRVVMKEMPALRCRIVDLSMECEQSEILSLAEAILSDATDGAEEEIALCHDERFVHRLRTTSLARLADALPVVDSTVEQGWRAEIGTTGSLDSVVFRRNERRTPAAHEVEVAIQSASLNFRDIVLATGIVSGLETDNTFGKKMLGSDFAGTVTRCGEDVTNLKVGDEVLGIAPSSFSSYTITNSALVARRPRSLTDEDAANIPVAFVTAWYGLKHLARLSAGETILIHAASGGVGLAAIQIAKLLGATVFATAGSDAKRSYLRSFGIEHVMDSRSLAFADEVREHTSGRGVDVILNSLAGEALAAGIASLAPYGRFVELGKADIYQNQPIGLGPFRKNLSLFAVDLDRMSMEKPELIGEMLREVVEQFNSGTFTPLPCKRYSMNQLPEAMRLMAQAKHIGKVVVQNQGPVGVRSSIEQRVPVRENSTYLVSGGLGGVGLSVARWLADRGAGSILLCGRSAPSTEAEITLNELRGRGVRIEIAKADISRSEDVARIIDFIAASMSPLRGIVHGAMVLDDTPIAELTRGSLDRVMAPKILGAWNLHTLTSKLPLDFFVSFSSITSLMGNPHQANYAAANTFLDAFAHYRRELGLPATTINWGVISETGYVSRHPEVAEFLAKQGYLSFTPEQTLEVLGELLKHEATQAMAARIDWKKLREFAPRAAASSRIRHLVPTNDGDTRTASAGSIRSSLEHATSSARKQRLEDYLRQQVGKLLGSSGSGLDIERPITELGMDSLIAAELTVLLERDLGVQVDGGQLLGGLNLRGLGQQILQRLRLGEGTTEPVSGATSQFTERPQVNAAAIDHPVPSSNAGRAEKSAPPHAPIAITRSSVAGVVAPPVASSKQPPRLDFAPAASSDSTHRVTVDYRKLDYSSWSLSQRMVRAISKTAFGVISDVETAGLKNIPTRGPCVLAINHLSMTEVPLLLNLLPRRAIVLVNQKWKKVRAIDWLVSGLGQAIYVTPGEPRDESLQPALAVLEAGGILSLAPEGTRSRTGVLQQARTGVAYLAVRANVPVIPLALWGHEQWINRLKRVRRFHVHVRVGEPIRFPAGPASAAALRQYTDDVMIALARLLPIEYRGFYAELAERDSQEVSTTA
jgi:acyl transferase domain-containing protein/1-acyl-sn-glycerol-3-phosphate acyltransferase/NADP-dependent 3-hydroxy acid dehydrogenase YdfG/acyl carrier protein